jgi:endonuclease III
VSTWTAAGANGKSRSQVPEKTRVLLEQWLPKELWSEINFLLVGFGQEVCGAVSPKCAQCGISSICPSAASKGKLG